MVKLSEIPERLVVADDGGNNTVVTAFVTNKGRMVQGTIPHYLVPVTGEMSMGDGVDGGLIAYADICGKRWGYGPGALEYTIDKPITLHQNTKQRYGDEMHINLSLIGMAESGIPDGAQITLIVTVPPGLLKEVKQHVTEAFLAGEHNDGSGRFSVQLRGDKKPRTYAFKSVVVRPEGYSGYCGYRFDSKGDVVNIQDQRGGDALAGTVCVIDLGAGTGNILYVRDGIPMSESINNSTNDRGGVLTHILGPALAQISTATGAKHLTVAHVDAMWRRWIMNPTKEGSKNTVSGKDIFLMDLFIALSHNYAKFVQQTFVDPAIRLGSDAIAEVGGGWLSIHELIAPMYKDFLFVSPLLSPALDVYAPKHWNTPKPHPYRALYPLVVLNAVGMVNYQTAKDKDYEQKKAR